MDLGPLFSSHRDTVEHRGSSPADYHSSTRQVALRAAGLITAVRVEHRSGGDRHRDTYRDRHRDRAYGRDNSYGPKHVATPPTGGTAATPPQLASLPHRSHGLPNRARREKLRPPWKPRPPPPCPPPLRVMSWNGTGEEHRGQDDDDPHPLLEFTSTLMPVIHGSSPLVLSHNHQCPEYSQLSSAGNPPTPIYNFLARLQFSCWGSCIHCVLA